MRLADEIKVRAGGPGSGRHPGFAFGLKLTPLTSGKFDVHYRGTQLGSISQITERDHGWDYDRWAAHDAEGNEITDPAHHPDSQEKALDHMINYHKLVSLYDHRFSKNNR